MQVIGSNGKIEIDPALMLMPRTTIKGVQASIQEPVSLLENIINMAGHAVS